jgi:hypothetical protein
MARVNVCTEMFRYDLVLIPSSRYVSRVEVIEVCVKLETSSRTLKVQVDSVTSAALNNLQCILLHLPSRG